MPTAILGMLRSGTSMMSRLLNLSGLYIGDEKDVFWTGDANPKGFWEPRWLIDLNDRLLASLGGNWESPPLFEPGWESEPAVRALRDEARERVSQAYGQSQNWGWKSPTTAVCIPFWREIVPDLRFVICVRNPLDVAASAKRVWNLTEPHAISLWQYYSEAALRDTRPEERVVAMYEDFFADYASALAPVLRLIGLPELAPGSERDRAVRSFIDGELKHYSHTLKDVLSSDTIPLEAKQLYQALCENHGASDPEAAVASLLADDAHATRMYQVIDRASRRRFAWKLYELSKRENEGDNLQQICTDMGAEIQRLRATFCNPPYSYVVRLSSFFRRLGPLYGLLRRRVQRTRDSREITAGVTSQWRA